MYVAATKKLGMQSKFRGNVVYYGAQLPLLVTMLFLPAIPKSLLILKKNLYTIKEAVIVCS